MIFQVLPIAAFFFAALAPASAQERTPQTLEEINADLLKKKAELEPFDEKDVKIDVESLGLDDVDSKKPEEKSTETKITESKTSETAAPAPPEPPIPLQSSEPPAPLPNPIVPASKDADKPAAESEGGVLSKIQNMLNKPKTEEVKPAEVATPAIPEVPEIKAQAAPQNKTDKYINSAKKRNLKKRLEEEKIKKQNEKVRQDKLKQLKKLREEYLIKINKDKIADAVHPDEDFEEDAGKIVPHPKEINRFTLEELPAPPILNRYRSPDNLHIPIVLTPRERIQIMFDAINSGKPEFFNSAYKDIQNPNARNAQGDTPLTYATLFGRHSVMASVLAKGADPMLPNGLGYTPGDIAIEMVDIKALDLLFENGAKVDYTDNFGRTYLMHAARVGFLPAVELLVQKGADVNAMDNDGFTALSIAYRHRKEIIVRYLLKNGAKTWIEKPYDPGEQSLIKELENRWR